jgi:hypothetical protein
MLLQAFFRNLYHRRNAALFRQQWVSLSQLLCFPSTTSHARPLITPQCPVRPVHRSSLGAAMALCQSINAGTNSRIYDCNSTPSNPSAEQTFHSTPLTVMLQQEMPRIRYVDTRTRLQRSIRYVQRPVRTPSYSAMPHCSGTAGKHVHDSLQPLLTISPSACTTPNLAMLVSNTNFQSR